MEEEKVITKVCKKCGRELPLSEFHLNSKMKDGHINECRDCAHARKKRYYQQSKLEKELQITPPHTTLTENSELAKFKPIELIAELRRRGYTGELQYVHKIKL